MYLISLLLYSIYLSQFSGVTQIRYTKVRCHLWPQFVSFREPDVYYSASQMLHGRAISGPTSSSCERAVFPYCAIAYIFANSLAGLKFGIQEWASHYWPHLVSFRVPDVYYSASQMLDGRAIPGPINSSCEHAVFPYFFYSIHLCQFLVSLKLGKQRWVSHSWPHFCVL